MSFVCPLPPVKVFVRAEYLYNHTRGHGQFVEGVWCSVKSIRGEAFRFETYLPEYAALYDKLPISAFVTDPAADGELPLDVLQIWDCLGYHVEVIEKPLLAGLRADVFCKDKVMRPGIYMFTLDGAQPDPRIPDFTFSQSPDEHKSYNLIRLDCGQFALQPNNRCLFYDNALSHAESKKPDFEVSTVKYTVEDKSKWLLGGATDFTYSPVER
jgi:hypothetical protein